MQKANRRTTVYDIAREAGVSAATVSRVLTGNGPVNEQKRENIMAILEKHNFRPSAVARSLKARRSHSVGCIVPDIMNPYFSRLYFEIERRFAQHDFSVLLCNSESIRKREMELLELMVEKEVEAIIMMGGIVDDVFPLQKHLKEVERMNLLVPIITTSKMPGVTCTQVYSDDRRGIFEMVRHFHENGHRTLGMIGGKQDVRPVLERRMHLLEAAGEIGMEIRSDWLVEGEYSIESGSVCMAQLLSLRERPTAVFAFNDVLAVGALAAVMRAGLRMPKDIALAGFDGIPLTESIYPGITTSTVDFDSFADAILNRVINPEKDAKENNRAHIYDTRLMVRGTTVLSEALSHF